MPPAIWILLGLTLAAAAGCLVMLALGLRRLPRAGAQEQLQQALGNEVRGLRAELNTDTLGALRAVSEGMANTLQQNAYAQDQRLRALQDSVAQQLGALQNATARQLEQLDARLDHSSRQSEQKLENLRQGMENRLNALRAENTSTLDRLRTENNQQLEEMRRTVDEKLQKTLEERLQRSFETVSNQLEQVYRGLGEMQTLAAGVGDLKKVLGNVKTRGILGEIQLGSILEEILTPEQYGRNVVTRPGRRDPVEFAIRLPGDGSGCVWLPVDAKFPLDLYARLTDAYDSGDAAAVEAAGRELEQRIRSCAKDIHEKYVEPPHTTEFAILFLPTEGLYAEVVRRGLVERLQRNFKINVAGPSTMAALLNSLQMGFQTLAIQKRSNEVWQVLAGVKAEFETFGTALASAQKRIRQVDSDLENLLGVRTRQMQRRLRAVQTLDVSAAAQPATMGLTETAGQPETAGITQAAGLPADGESAQGAGQLS